MKTIDQAMAFLERLSSSEQMTFAKSDLRDAFRIVHDVVNADAPGDTWAVSADEGQVLDEYAKAALTGLLANDQSDHPSRAAASAFEYAVAAIVVRRRVLKGLKPKDYNK